MLGAEIVNPIEFGNVSLIIFCYMLDLNGTCNCKFGFKISFFWLNIINFFSKADSIPDYLECYKNLTNNTNAISIDDLTVFSKNKNKLINMLNKIIYLRTF